MVIGRLVDLPEKFSESANQSLAGAPVASHHFLCTHLFTGLAPLGRTESFLRNFCVDLTTVRVDEERRDRDLFLMVAAFCQRPGQVEARQEEEATQSTFGWPELWPEN